MPFTISIGLSSTVRYVALKFRYQIFSVFYRAERSKPVSVSGVFYYLLAVCCEKFVGISLTVFDPFDHVHQSITSVV